MTRGQQHTHTTMYVHYTTASISVLANRTVYSTVVVVTMCLLACVLSQYSSNYSTVVVKQPTPTNFNMFQPVVDTACIHSCDYELLICYVIRIVWRKDVYLF